MTKSYEDFSISTDFLEIIYLNEWMMKFSCIDGLITKMSFLSKFIVFKYEIQKNEILHICQFRCYSIQCTSDYHNKSKK